MKKIRRGTDNLSNAEHEDMLNNPVADLYARIATYHDYIEIGYEPDVALEMAGLKKEELE